jgi:hypothetical protein
MAKEKVKIKCQRDPLPEHFASLEVAGEFWDMHDSTGYEDYMQDVDCTVEIKKRTYLISLDSELHHKME